jgi:hypothetical protein
MLYSLQRDKLKSRSAFSIINELLRLVPAWIVCEIPLNDLANQRMLRLGHKESGRQFCEFGENVQDFLQGVQGSSPARSGALRSLSQFQSQWDRR